MGGSSTRRISARTWKRIHYAMAVIWLTLALPTLRWWNESILWVAFMSLYANVASHWAAGQAAEADQHSPDA